MEKRERKSRKGEKEIWKERRKEMKEYMHIHVERERARGRKRETRKL